MATQADYTAGANALVAKANSTIGAAISQLPLFEQAAVRAWLTPAKINAAAGAVAQVVIDAVDAARAARNQKT